MKQHKISELFDVVSGSTPSTLEKKYWDGNIKWITPKDLSKLNDAIIFETERQITEDGLESCSTHIIPKDSIIISSRAPIGYVAILGDNMCCNQGCKALVPTQKINPYYFYYLLRTKNKQLNDLGTGSTFKELSKTKLEDFKVRIVDLQSQNEISGLLKKIDKARQLRKQANALTDQFLQSTFLSMFGDPLSNPKGWKVENIGNLIEFMTSGSRGWAKYYSEKGDVFLRINNVGYSELRTEDLIYVNTPDTAEAKRTLVKEGDVLFSITADLGRTAVIPRGFPPAYINQHLALLRLNKKLILPIFLTSFFATKSGRSQIVNKGGVKLGLNFDDIRNLKVYIPPIKHQQRFADIVAQTDQLRQRQRAHEQELEQLFKGLLQKYFG